MTIPRKHATVNYSTATPQPVGAVGSPGDLTAPVKAYSLGDHIHAGAPVPALTKRYYLTGQASDLPRQYPGELTVGYLLSTANPSNEAGALDVTNPAGASAKYIWFDTPPGEPGLTSWPSGLVMANLRVRVRNAHEGITYKLYVGGSLIVYETVLQDVTSNLVYQIAPFPDAPVLTSSYQTFRLPIYVGGLSGASNRRLRADILLWSDHQGVTTDEVFEVRCGGDDASYFDTLFTGVGGVTQHNDLQGRGYAPDNTKDCHPFSAITPGFNHTPTTQITTVDGLLDLSTATSNTIDLRGTEPLVGISTAGILDGDGIEILVMDAVPQAPDGREYRSFINQGVIDPIAHPGYCSMNFGTLGRGVPPSSLDLRRGSIIALRLSGGEWRLRYLFESENT